MKGNIKKLGLLMVITLIATFILAAPASADPPGQTAIRGQYVATGSQNCLLALCGVDAYYVPNKFNGTIDVWSVQLLSIEGIFEFKPNGTGTASMTKRSINLPPTLPTIPSASAAVAIDTWIFTYTVTHHGSISMQVVPDTYISKWIAGPYASTLTLNGVSFVGAITSDGTTITLNAGLPSLGELSPPILPPCGDATLICNTSLVLILKEE